MWLVKVDPRGVHEWKHRVKQANLVTRRAPGVPDEMEYLFAPFSAFKVLSVEWSDRPDDRTPHHITLEAYTDNRDASEDLPLTPWY